MDVFVSRAGIDAGQDTGYAIGRAVSDGQEVRVVARLTRWQIISLAGRLSEATEPVCIQLPRGSLYIAEPVR